MYGFGGFMCAVVPLLPDPDPSDHAVLLTAATVLGVAFLAIVALRPTRALALLTAHVGVLAVGALVLLARPLGAVPYFYVWPVLFSAMLLPAWTLWSTSALTVTTFAAALLLGAGAPEGGVVVAYVSACASAIGVGTVVRAMRDQRDRLEADLRHAAATDLLTGLPNRRAFEEALEAARRLAGPEHPLALVLLDVDHFKRINDRHGHAVGDRALQVLADGLRHCAPDAVAARVGGEEFALVMPGATEREARRAIDRLDRRLLDSDPSLPPTVEISTSAGIVTTTGRLDRDQLLHIADEALYLAKEQGRGRAVVGRAAAPGEGEPDALVVPDAPASRPTPV